MTIKDNLPSPSDLHTLYLHLPRPEFEALVYKSVGNKEFRRSLYLFVEREPSCRYLLAFNRPIGPHGVVIAPSLLGGKKGDIVSISPQSAHSVLVTLIRKPE